MEIQAKYKSVLSIVTSSLKQRGFKKQSSTFYIQRNGNWGLINFQKSLLSSSDKIIFTVNLGIASARLFRFFSEKNTGKVPNIWDCHWRTRLGELSESRDKWWPIEVYTSVDELSGSVLDEITNFAIPEIKKYIDDNELRDLWLSGVSPSLTEFQRLIFLTVFLKELGPHELLEPTLSLLKKISINKPTSITVDIHINRILEKS